MPLPPPSKGGKSLPTHIQEKNSPEGNSIVIPPNNFKIYIQDWRTFGPILPKQDPYCYFSEGNEQQLEDCSTSNINIRRNLTSIAGPELLVGEMSGVCRGYCGGWSRWGQQILDAGTGDSIAN